MTVLVAGPRRAGASSLAAALRGAMPERVIAESDELEAGEMPAAVVFVTSSIAPMTASDCDLIERACGYADLVVGAVSKIDAHRQWREVMAANRVLLAERGARYRDVPWVGVGAAPDLGDPNVDELLLLLTDGLGDPDLARRNRLRVNGTNVRTLRNHRAEIVRSHRSSAATVRAAVHQSRVRLTFGGRKRCARLVADLRRSAGEVSRGGSGLFEEGVRAAAEEFIGEVDAEIAHELSDVAARLGLGMPEVAGPPSPPAIGEPRLERDRLQLRLTAVLGAGFGAGVALASGRLLAGTLPGADVVGFVAGGVLGLLAAAWVIGARRLLHDRAALDRWVGEVAVALRAWGEEKVSTAALAAEIAFMSEFAARDESQAAQVRAIDAQLRRLGQ